MDNYIRSIIYSMECSIHRMKWYAETGEIRYLNESKDYLGVANIYMKEISKNESLESIN